MPGFVLCDPLLSRVISNWVKEGCLTQFGLNNSGNLELEH